MNFLLNYNITQETINKIKENNESSTIFLLETQRQNVIDIIKYLQSIQVETIDQLLINRVEFFLLPIEKIKRTFENYNLEILVQLINEDISVLNNIEEK